jgi:molybdenum transport protein
MISREMPDPMAGDGRLAWLDDNALDHLLQEDVPYGDLTTEGLGIGAVPGHITFTARSAMVVCGIEEAARLFERRQCQYLGGVARGRAVGAGSKLLEVRGPAGALHGVWKTAQTLVEVASGIATATAQVVAAVRGIGKQPAVVTTRKNFPGTRALSSLATRAGGATAHRLGLSETLLVFPEHLAFLDPMRLEEHLKALRRRHPERKLVVEVRNEDEAMQLAIAGAEVLQLEKFTPGALERTARSLEQAGLTPLLAAAGGVNAGNAAEYAQAGADVLVTSAPYWAPPADVKVVLIPGS